VTTHAPLAAGPTDLPGARSRTGPAVRVPTLQVSVDKKTWGNFDVGDGVKAGDTETFVWDESTNNEPCEEWIRAKFSDGEWSPASHQNFCKDMDAPIEFTE